MIYYWSFCGRALGWGGRLFEAGRLLTFSAFRIGAFSRWALIRGWALMRINTVFINASLKGHFDFYDPSFLSKGVNKLTPQAIAEPIDEK